MLIQIRVFNPQDLNQRAYIEYYYLGKRFKEYNGKRLSLNVNPNRTKTLKEREKLLKGLLYEFQKAFDSGWTPNKLITVEKADKPTLLEALQSILDEKLLSNYSNSYKNNLQTVIKQFSQFILQENHSNSIDTLSDLPFDDFLSQFKSSATYYMNKRRILGVFFSELVRKRLTPFNPVKDTPKQKSQAKLHQIYSQAELKDVLAYLKTNYPNLYFCCLLAYGCFLRPHQETRLLMLKHINAEVTKIRLSGSENKSRRVRVVNIPSYVQEELQKRLLGLTEPATNIITSTIEPFNVCYFNLQWSRAKIKMRKLGIIKPHQTIYSFRHTAAVTVYRKTKDLNILQQLLGHSNMIVTLKYLRGLGEATNEDLMSSLPELDFT